MTYLFASGWIVDLILVAMVIETVALLMYRFTTGRGIPVAALWINLLAGGFLLLALRSALLGHSWIWMSGWLAMALVAHIADLAQRWQS